MSFNAGNKLLMEYIGLPQDNYFKFEEDYNLMFQVIEKLEKEDLTEYFYSWETSDDGRRDNFQGISIDRFDGLWDANIQFQLDPPKEISKTYKGRKDNEQLFLILRDTVEYVNKLKR